jgi:uncharacterized protein DUF6843
MILPYLATALLVLATVYSVIVSFRPKPESGEAGWIFPDRTRRSVRIFVVALTVLISVVAWFGINPRSAARNTPSRSLHFFIPEGYSGWARVEFEVSGQPPLPSEAGQTVLKIPSSGTLRTSSPEEYGWARDYYYFYSDSGSRPLADSGPGRMIWGKINGEAAGVSGRRKYEEFFVGTEEQYRDQAKVK